MKRSINIIIADMLADGLNEEHLTCPHFLLAMLSNGQTLAPRPSTQELSICERMQFSLTLSLFLYLPLSLSLSDQ